jgi:hypothetical protein
MVREFWNIQPAYSKTLQNVKRWLDKWGSTSNVEGHEEGAFHMINSFLAIP